MFTPQAVWATTFLKTLKDPPKSISWRPTHSFISCDGRTAVNSGPWFTQEGQLGGAFATVWQKTPRGWRWVYDGGMATSGRTSTTTALKLRQASCSPRAPGAPIQPPPALSPAQAVTTPQDNGRGESADGTLGWDWKVTASGARTFRVFLWTGGRYAQVIHATDPAPKAK
jgi:hypothetical protein